MYGGYVYQMALLLMESHGYHIITSNASYIKTGCFLTFVCLTVCFDFTPFLLKAITHGGSLSILNYESYHYALSREMTQGA